MMREKHPTYTHLQSRSIDLWPVYSRYPDPPHSPSLYFRLLYPLFPLSTTRFSPSHAGYDIIGLDRFFVQYSYL